MGIWCSPSPCNQPDFVTNTVSAVKLETAFLSAAVRHSRDLPPYHSPPVLHIQQPRFNSPKSAPLFVGHSVNIVGCLKVGKMNLGDRSKSSCLASRLNEDGASWWLSYLRSPVKMPSGKIQDLCFMLSSHLAAHCSLPSTVWNKRYRNWTAFIYSFSCLTNHSKQLPAQVTPPPLPAHHTVSHWWTGLSILPKVCIKSRIESLILGWGTTCFWATAATNRPWSVDSQSKSSNCMNAEDLCERMRKKNSISVRGEKRAWINGLRPLKDTKDTNTTVRPHNQPGNTSQLKLLWGVVFWKRFGLW